VNNRTVGLREEIALIQNLRGIKMPKTFIVSLAFMLVFSLAASIAGADLFEEGLQIIDNEYQDKVFGGDEQQELIITFIPDLNHDAGEDDGKDGDYAIIVDVDDDGDFNDDDIIVQGNAVNGTLVTYRMNRSKLSGIADGKYELAVVIDDIANGKIDWGDEDDDTENFTLDRTLTITEVAVDPETFSPNGDGVNDKVTIYYTLSESLSGSNQEVTITVGADKLIVPARPTAGTAKGRNSVSWDGKDGLGNYVEDDTYNIKIEAKDRGGNEEEKGTTVKVSTKKPEIDLIEPAEDFVRTLTEVKAQLTDHSGEGLDLDKSTIKLKNPSGDEIAGTKSTSGLDTIILKLSSVLPGDGSADGLYTAEVTAYDNIGNTETISYTFFYDTVFPIITSITPANGAVLTASPSSIVVVLTDGTGSGPDLASTADTLVVHDSNGLTVHNGVDTITFTPFEELEAGKYTIEISPTDFAGNEPSQLREFEFTIVEDITDILPEIVSTNPPENSFVNTVSQVTATLKDNSGKGLDLDASTIRLENSQGVTIQGRQSNHENDTITWKLTESLSTTGSADGTYTIKVKAVDKNGGQTEENFTFIYDTQVPVITSITPEDGSVIAATPLTEVVIKVGDGTGSGVNFAVSKGTMSLTGVLNIIRQDNGVDTMTFTFPALEETGKYTIEVTLTDNAGNEYTYISEFSFFTDIEDVLPEITAVGPRDRGIANSLPAVGVALKDNSGKGIDFNLSTIRLEDSQGVEVSGIQVVSGYCIDCEGNLTIDCDCVSGAEEDTIAWELLSPLPTNGSADGTYTIKVKAVDKAGRELEDSFTFMYDTQVLMVTSITPADGSILTTAPTEIVIQVSDGAGSGADFAASMSTMSLSGVSGNSIVREDNGVDTMTFTFPALEDTGTYTVSITLKDKAGNEFAYQSEFDFVADTTDVLPEIVSIDPADNSAVNAVSHVEATLRDNSGKGLDLNLSTITLVNSMGVTMPGRQVDDGNDTITWVLTNPLATDGSADNTYTIKVKAVDKAGRELEDSFTFVYDTQVLVVTSITPADGSVLTTAPTEIVMQVSDGAGSGADFALSMNSMSLSGVSGDSIVREDNGVDTMTFTFPALEDTGTYTVSITLTDNAGNEFAYQSEFDFVADTTDVLPEIVSVDPADNSAVNAVSQVEATLRDNSGKGLDLNLSTITLVNSTGVTMPGRQVDDGNDTITWVLTNPLPTDGSADNTYTIKVKAVDKAGRELEDSFTFVYDTQVLVVTSITPADGSVLTTAPTEVVIQVSDGAGSGADFAASMSTMTLSGVSGDSIVREDNGVDTMTFTFPALEDTGTYTVSITLKDKAGNEFAYQSEFDFVADTTDVLPEIVSVAPADNSAVNAVSQVEATLRDNSGKGLDLNLSTITLENSEGVVAPGRQVDDGNDTIIWILTNPLATDGSVDDTYAIKVKAVDKAGRELEDSFTFMYDTQVPVVTSITPADGDVLTEAISAMVIQVSDGAGSGVDFAASKGTMSLTGVSNIVRQDNGADTMTFTFPALENIGRYAIGITIRDNAGNEYIHESKFDFVEKSGDVLPDVVSLEPPERAFVNSLSQVVAVLRDNSGKGIDLDLSTMSLEDPQGVAVPGVQTDDGSDTITLELSSPRPTDGSADGTHTIKIKAVDKAGGVAEESFTFLFDTLSPSVVSTTPAANDAFYEGISQVTVELNDGDGSGVDLDATSVNVQGPNGQVQADRSDNGVGIITLTFSTLTDTGNYVIQINPLDRADNAGYPVEVKFSYVLKAPAVKSVSLTNQAYVDALDSIEAVLEDRSGIGLDLSETGSSIVVIGPDGELQADQTGSGDDTLTWTPVHSLAKDGTDDGEYEVTVTPMDTTGASGQPRQYIVIYDTQTPEVVSASPVDINADITHVGQQLISVQASLTDEGPAGIEIEDQAIYLEAADGTQVPGVQTDDNDDTVNWNLANPLAKDGSADGIYNVVVNSVDKAGNEKEFRYPLLYDTIPPAVVEVSPAENALVTSSITEVSAKLEDSGDGAIDFQQSEIEVRTPNGSIMSGLLSNDGVSEMTLSFASLEINGTYTVLVTAVDKAGNGSNTSWETEFVYETGLPVVISTTPITDSPDRAFVNQQLTQVTVRLRETGDGGIDLSATGSKIGLRGPDGNLIIGEQTDNGINTLTFTLSRARSSDGTEDGEYAIIVNPVNAAKRRDEQDREFKFIYDTQAPVVVSASPVDIDAELSYVHEQITQMEATLMDEGPAGIDLDRSSMTLIDPNGDTVDSDISDDDEDTMWLKFPAGLSAEGTYRLEINAVDKAKNSTTVRADFIYSINIPEVVSTIPATTPAEEAYANTQLRDVRVELRETGSSGIDLSATGSTIRLRGPKGDVTGIQSDDGEKILIYTLTNSLAVDGSDDGAYTISVTPVNAAKLMGPTVEFEFFYDTVNPEVDTDNIFLWSSGEAGSSLSEISVVLTDAEPGSGIDWENASDSWMKLQNTTSGKEIIGRVYVDQETSNIILVLDVALASNGGEDGYYTVIISPRDKAGNTLVVQYEFYYDTRPPTVNMAEISINDKPLETDSALDAYPTAVNTKNGVTIIAKLEDDGVGIDLTQSSITVSGPGGDVTGSLMQDGVDTIWLTTGLLHEEGIYNVNINPVDLSGNGASGSSATISTQFLFETHVPEANLTEPADGELEAEDEPIELKGTATDRASGGENNSVAASGVAKVEIGGTGPGGKELDWIQAVDESDADEEPWSTWSLDYLPDTSGTYELEIRVWDNAGNFEVYDANLKIEFTISLSFQRDAYCWPNPVTNGVAHISFEVNAPESRNVDVTLFVYDVSGDLVYEETHYDIPSRTRTSVEWECVNAAENKVATGIYIFRLESKLDDQVANKIGKPMVIKN